MEVEERFTRDRLPEGSLHHPLVVGVDRVQGDDGRLRRSLFILDLHQVDQDGAVPTLDEDGSLVPAALILERGQCLLPTGPGDLLEPSPEVIQLASVHTSDPDSEHPNILLGRPEERLRDADCPVAAPTATRPGRTERQRGGDPGFGSQSASPTAEHPLAGSRRRAGLAARNEAVNA